MAAVRLIISAREMMMQKGLQLILFCVLEVVAFHCCPITNASGSDFITNELAYQQWKICFSQQIRIWNTATSLAMEWAWPIDKEIRLSDLSDHVLGGTNVSSCPAGHEYAQTFTREHGPICPMHPIKDREAISCYIGNISSQEKIKLLNERESVGLRRYILMSINSEDAKQLPKEIERLLNEALTDSDVFTRKLARDSVCFFVRRGYIWAKKLVELHSISCGNDEQTGVRDAGIGVGDASTFPTNGTAVE